MTWSRTSLNGPGMTFPWDPDVPLLRAPIEGTHIYICIYYIRVSFGMNSIKGKRLSPRLVMLNMHVNKQRRTLFKSKGSVSKAIAISK